MGESTIHYRQCAAISCLVRCSAMQYGMLNTFRATSSILQYVQGGCLYSIVRNALVDRAILTRGPLSRQDTVTAMNIMNMNAGEKARGERG